MNMINLIRYQHARYYRTKQINYMAVKTVVKLDVSDLYGSLGNNITAACFLAGIVRVTGKLSKSVPAFSSPNCL